MGGENIKFEKALERLEEIVNTLEGGDLELDKSLKMFEEGIKMARACQTHLSDAEKKIEKLVRDQKGNLATEPLDEEAAEETEEEAEEEKDQDELPF